MIRRLMERIVLCTLLLFLRTVSTLKCYQCSNLIDEKCGINWKLAGNEDELYLKECHSTATTCNKIVGELQGDGNQYVYRKCWNQTTTENYTPSGCKEQFITGTIICHCSRDGCNRSVSSSAVFSYILTPVLVAVTMRYFGHV